jgi:hypothetical protein
MSSIFGSPSRRQSKILGSSATTGLLHNRLTMIQTLRAQRMIYSLSTTLTICDINSCRSHHFDVTPKFNYKLWMALGELLDPNTRQVTLTVFVKGM